MKRIIFTLLALVGTMSMNAQVTQAFQLMKDGKVVKTYTVAEVDAVVCKEILITTGTAKATIGGQEVDVNWVQLWAGGPKFAEYNIGATSATEYGGYYTWGGTYKNGADITWNDDHTTGESNLSCTGDSITDTATYHWGSNWRMPTKEEFDNLLAKCTVEWTTVGGVSGRKFTGKDAYADNSVFLPAANFCYEGVVFAHGYGGDYWSSTAYDSNDAYDLYFSSGNQGVQHNSRYCGYSVRAVLAE